MDNLKNTWTWNDHSYFFTFFCCSMSFFSIDDDMLNYFYSSLQVLELDSKNLILYAWNTILRSKILTVPLTCLTVSCMHKLNERIFKTRSSRCYKFLLEGFFLFLIDYFKIMCLKIFWRNSMIRKRSRLNWIFLFYTSNETISTSSGLDLSYTNIPDNTSIDLCNQCPIDHLQIFNQPIITENQ